MRELPANSAGAWPGKVHELKRDDVRLSQAIKKLGRPMTYYPSLARLVGLKESIFLCQLMYWTPRAHSEDGWIFKSVEEMEEETGLNYREQGRIRESLLEQRMLEEEYRRNEHRLYFRVSVERLDSLGEEHMTNGHMTKSQMAPDETSPGTLPNVSSHLTKGQIDKGSRDYTETTTEITQGGAPDGLHPLQYATRLLEEIGHPDDYGNKRAVAGSIECEVRRGKSLPAAYQFVLAGTLAAIKEGYKINKFFFTDALYREENRRNGNGSGNGQRPAGAAAERDRRNVESLVRAARNHIAKRTQDHGDKLKIGTD